MKYSDIISINKNFQYSVNIGFDLFDEKRIDEYIPTSDVCAVLKIYIKAVLGYEKAKATTLIGPYGKGKSLLILVLLYLIGNDQTDTNSYMSLLDRINKIDNELYKYLMEYKKSKNKMLPVIISSNYNDLSQSFLLALNESLNRASLQKLVPNTVYGVCLNVIKDWETDSKLKHDILKKCLEKYEMDLEQLKKELSDYSREAYSKFEDLYNCVVKGLKFNPMISDDIVKVYSSINYQLKKIGYSGIFIVFDEFSKFLESQSSNLMSDLKVIQDFAELANRSSKDCQLHLCCIIHKSINLYSANKNDNRYNSFRTVEGRFKELRFNRSLEENYEIISATIRKSKKCKSYINKFIKTHNSFYNGVEQVLPSANEALYIGCFPLNPVTTFSLVNLSELIAQNERTLFTFISDDDANSLNSFIESDSGGLFNVDKLYDYFNVLLKKDENEYIRSIWYKTEASLSKCSTILEKRIIKCISIYLIINDQEKLPITYGNVAFGLFEGINDVSNAIDKMIMNHIIKRNFINNCLSFASINSKKIQSEVELVKTNKLRNVTSSMVLNDIFTSQFFLPRRYNEQNKITRFFKSIYLEYDEIIDLKNYDVLFAENYCDGIVINVLCNDNQISKLKNQVKIINDEKVIVRFPSKQIPNYLKEELLNFEAMKQIEKCERLADDSELKILMQEEKNDLITLIGQLFNNGSEYVNSSVHSEEFNDLLSIVSENTYTKKIIINNELINKKTVSAQYQKAINNVIDFILDNKNVLPASETSPEKTIYNSVVKKISNGDLPEIIVTIKSFIYSSEGIRKPLSELTKVLVKEPYGIRLGILPILFAIAISELPDNVVLYYQTKQIDFNPINLVKAVNVCDDKYKVSLSRGTKEKREYLRILLKHFNIEEDQNFRINEKNVFEMVRSYFTGLPNITRECTYNNNYLELSEGFIKTKFEFMKFNINSFDTLFDKIPTFYNCTLIKGSHLLISDIQELRGKIFKYKEVLRDDTLKLFDNGSTKKDSIKSIVDSWLSGNEKNIHNIIFENTQKNLLNCLKTKIEYNDFQALNDISKAIIGLHIEDWDYGNRDKFIDIIKKFIELVEKNKETKSFDNIDVEISNENQKISEMGSIVKNSLENVLDEYGDSITNEEKVRVLMSLVKEIM